MSKSHSSVQIAIAGHKYDDREYLIERVRPMFEARFGRPFHLRELRNENSMQLYAYSKQIALTLHEWGMPFGKKKLSSLTPNVSLDEVSFVRGFFDTDGSVYCKYGPYLQIQFKSANPALMTYVKDCLTRLGLHPTAIRRDDTKFRFCLSRQNEVDRFFRLTGPRNSKHLKRFHHVSGERVFRSYTHRSKRLKTTI
ncbi:LAGLIDADG family homing endonuclease [Candidatus Bathyarchaeota archaeon]|nr:LAGLIDADG family homing endonuclease [Candidatus Bathyarchaeota archaeon]